MSIGRQLLLAFFTLVLSLFGVLGFFAYTSLAEQLKAEVESATLAQGQLLKAHLEQIPADQWPEEIRRAALACKARISISAADGRQLFNSDPRGRLITTPSGPAIHEPDRETLSKDLPIAVTGGPLRLSLERPLVELELALEAFRFKLVLAGLLTLVLTAVAGFVLSRWLTQPLDRLVDLADRYGKGEFEARIPTGGATEIEKLSQQFHRMAQQLETREERLESYVSDASHELRTPISSLKSLTEALRGGGADSPKHRERFLDHMQREVKRLEDLTERLLLLYRLQEGQEMKSTSFDLGELVSECSGEVPCHCPDKGPMVEGDPVLVEQVVRNLISNAKAATCGQDDPKVEITVADNGLVEVGDNGIGIPEAEGVKVFERFYRVQNDRSRRTGGSGLGLPLCKLIVERHGGSIWMQSRPGEGTSFYFRLS